MEQYVVPQFIDVEDKIFGPITTRQFLILLTSSLILFIIFKLADFALFVFFVAIVGGMTLILAFAKVNGQSFHYVLLNIVQTLRRPSLRIWNKFQNNQELNESRLSAKVEILEKAAPVPRLSYNRIRDLSLVVNTGGYYKPE